jgi:cardiolipin synthase A/B
MPETEQDKFYPSGNLKLVRGGQEYFQTLIALINKAQDSIHLQTYIIDDDKTGLEVLAALTEAVKRKVSVYILADGYASQRISRHVLQEIRTSGIHFRYFEPLFKGKHFYFGRRMHQKIFVADAKYALVGGINIADKYNDFLGKPAWLDFALYTEGEIAVKLCVQCWKTWNGFPVNMGETPCEKVKSPGPEQHQNMVRMRRNDWVRRKNEISSSYIQILREAKSEVIIACSYFLPGRIIRRLLASATRRGVQVKVITAGISDVRIAKDAERWLYDWLLRNNIQLYEFQPTVLHAKIAVCDQRWMTIGSYNVNNISAYASIELNLDVKDEAFVKQVSHQLKQIIKDDCILITPEQHLKSRNALIEFKRWLAYHFIKMIFYLFTFYFKQRKN